MHGVLELAWPVRTGKATATMLSQEWLRVEGRTGASMGGRAQGRDAWLWAAAATIGSSSGRAKQ